jgi:hypothetical protein
MVSSKSEEDTIITSALKNVSPEYVRYFPVRTTIRRAAETKPASAEDVKNEFPLRLVIYYTSLMTYEDGNGPRKVETCRVFIMPPVGGEGSGGSGPPIRMDGGCMGHNTAK